MKSKKNRRKMTLLALLLLVGTISIGYALMSTVLHINGSAAASAETWNVHFANLGTPVIVGGDDVTVTTAANIPALVTTPSDNSDDDTVTFAVSFKKPNDSYSFTVDIENTGSLYAKCTGITATTLTGDAATYLEYSYSGIAENDVIGPNKKRTVTVTVNMKNLTTLPASAISSTEISITPTFTQTNPQASNTGDSIGA